MGSQYRRFISLRYKIIAIIIVFQILLIVSFLIPTVAWHHQDIENSLKASYSSRLCDLCCLLAPAYDGNSSKALSEALKVLARDEAVAYCVLYKPSGEQIAGFDPHDLSELIDTSLFAEESNAELANMKPIFREREPEPEGFFHLGGHIYDWTHPVRGDAGLVGYMNLGVRSTSVNRSVMESTKRGMLISLFALCIGGGLAFWVDRKMRQSLGQMTVVTSRMAGGDLSSRVQISTGDELEVLGGSFNAMADALAQREQDLIRARETLEETVAERTAELRASQQSLVQQEKMVGIGQLAAGVAHEINTPITTIITSTKIIAEDIGDPELKKDVERVQTEARRCKEIVESLLNFSRTSDQSKSIIDLNYALNEAVSLVRHEMNLKGIHLGINGSAEALPVHACKNEIVQVIFNLLQNGKDAMPDGGKITVESWRSEDEQAWIAIADSGCGVPQELQSRIFEPFFTTKDIGRGTGLGLAISYRIMQDHGGMIRLLPSREAGSTFEINLPLARNGQDD